MTDYSKLSDDEIERQKFERWQRTLDYFNEECLTRDTHGEYWWRGVECEWNGWQACANLGKSKNS